jgi:hypothetical protein
MLFNTSLKCHILFYDRMLILLQIVGNNMNVSFMWQLEVGCLEDTCPIKTEFTVHYSPIVNVTNLVSEGHTQTYRCNFDITDYKV